MPDGFRTFAAGEKFLASRVMGYFMEQIVAVFATTAARDAAITAPEEGQHCLITGTYDLWQEYNGTAWVTTLARGAGTPEGNVTAAIGCMFQRTDGGAGTTLYVKESGAGNTGWIAFSTGTGETAWWIDAAELSSHSGTPVIGAVETGGLTGWMLDGAADEYVQCIWRVPAGVSQFDIDVYWSNTTTTAGNVQLAIRSGITAVEDGVDQGNIITSLQTATVAAPTVIGQTEVTEVATDRAVTAGMQYPILVGRRGSQGADTLNAIDICVHGILIRKN